MECLDSVRVLGSLTVSHGERDKRDPEGERKRFVSFGLVCECMCVHHHRRRFPYEDEEGGGGIETTPNHRPNKQRVPSMCVYVSACVCVGHHQTQTEREYVSGPSNNELRKNLLNHSVLRHHLLWQRTPPNWAPTGRERERERERRRKNASGMRN